jgi:hypothetical protein
MALADLALSTSPISLSAQVNNYAQLAFALINGRRADLRRCRVMQQPSSTRLSRLL